MKRYRHTVLAIDPSSVRLALVVTWPRGEAFEVIELPKDKVAACGTAYLEIGKAIERFTYRGSLPIVLCERQVGSPRGGYNALIPQAHVAGALMAATDVTGAPFLPVQVGAWKKRVVGVGNAGKELISDRIHVLWSSAWEAAQTYPKTKGRQDIIDAAAINLYGRMLLNAK
jgi:hypothetical protein